MCSGNIFVQFGIVRILFMLSMLHVLNWSFFLEYAEPYGWYICSPYHQNGQHTGNSHHSFHENRFHGYNFESLPAILNNICFHKCVSFYTQNFLSPKHVSLIKVVAWVPTSSSVSSKYLLGKYTYFQVIKSFIYGVIFLVAPRK